MQLTIIAGNIGKDPELRTTNSGDKVLGFSVAVNNGKDKSGNERPATWWDCSVWGKRAESLGWLSKGMKLTLSGRPSARCYEGKAYMQLSVDQITPHGGGKPKDEAPQDQGSYGEPSGYGAGGSAMDDEIPFAPEVRA